MADANQQPERQEAGDKPRPTMATRLAAMQEWTAESRWRGMAVGGGLILMVAGTVGTWLYLASLTVTHHVPTIDDALAAYDRRELEDARMLVVKMTEQGTLTTEEYGGPLFVLGAIKAAEAENQWSAQHRRSFYLIASKYLREAESTGYPPGRKEEGQYLLGRSLIESGDVEAGTQVLEAALIDAPNTATQLHLTIAYAYLLSSEPKLRKALEHIDIALADSELSDSDRNEALLNRIDTLMGLERFEEARATLESIPKSEAYREQVRLSTARLDLAEARRQLVDKYDRDNIPPQLRRQITNVVEQLRQAPPSSRTAEQSLYLAGQAHAMVGDYRQALGEFEQVRNRFSNSPVGIAASIAEGDLLRSLGKYEQAMTAYRRSLTALEDPRAYQNRLLPLGELRQRLLAAYADLIAKDQFDAASRLVEQLYPLFSRTKQLEMRAATLSSWGTHLVNLVKEEEWNRKELLTEGRLRLREAGVFFEELAKKRFATERYPDEIWRSAENYFLGHSYSSAVRLLNEYLKNEPVKRNAQALLRLGQSHLALRNLTEGIAAIEECIELHPQDAAVYRARLDCAKAYRDRDDIHHAEQLLLANINQGQHPSSNEWRLSLFELGHLLYDSGRYPEAIDRLDEAIKWFERYPDTGHVKLAKYLTGESHRHAAAEPLAELEVAKTVNERESASRDARKHLLAARQFYEDVRKQINRSSDPSLLDKVMVRNCYMMEGAVLFDLGRVEGTPKYFEDAMTAYAYVSTVYQDQPFVLEPLVQIAACERRLKHPLEARMKIAQAMEFLQRMPPDADFLATTNFTRNEWQMLLTEMLEW